MCVKYACPTLTKTKTKLTNPEWKSIIFYLSGKKCERLANIQLETTWKMDKEFSEMH